MAARLKVFVTSDGLTDYVVATTSKAKALAAWGSHQDLFKTGLAHETDDAALVRTASAEPDVVLRKPAGTRAELARLKPAKKLTSAKASGPSKAALKKVADLEKRLAKHDAEHQTAMQAIESERAALDHRVEALTSQYESRRARLVETLQVARQALG